MSTIDRSTRTHLRTLALALLGAAVIIFTIPCRSQGNTGVPFLLISPFTEANGMGQASVALATDDPVAVATNPAHLGAQSLSNNISFGNNYSSWLPMFNLANLWLRTYAVTAGINLKTITENAPPLSVGVGYSRIYLNLGDFVETSEQGPEEIGRVHAFESSDQYSIGVNLDYWIRASAGVTYKHVVSRLSMGQFQTSAAASDGKANLYDYGFLLDVPLVEIASRLTPYSFGRGQNLSPFIDFSVGISKSNLGQESISYPGLEQQDPLPRLARAGIGFELGAVYVREDLRWKPYSFKWTIEASDVCVGADRNYQSGLGDIRFVDEVILGNTNKETMKGKGWEFSALEIFSLRAGRYEEDPARGNRRFSTSGWGVRFLGFAKLLRASDAEIGKDGIAGFILNHLDLQYQHSEWVPDDYNSPLKGTKFDAVKMSLRL